MAEEQEYLQNILKFHFGTVFTTTPVSLMRRLHVLHLKETIAFDS